MKLATPPASFPDRSGQETPAHLDKVSVVIPFYNVEAYLAECMDSVLRQSYTNLEIILVDDCSPDASRQIAQDYAQRDSRIKLITHQHNQGLGPARHSGADVATGDYLFFLDSDDILSPNAIQTAVNSARHHAVPLVVGSCDQLSDEGEISPFDRNQDQGQPETFGAMDGEEALRRVFSKPGGYYLPLRATGVLIDRDLFQHSQLRFPAVEHEDMAVTPFLYYLAGRICFLEDIALTYRQHNTGLSSQSWSKEKIARYQQLWNEIQHTIKRLGLEPLSGDIATHMALHLLYRLNTSGYAHAALEAAVTFLSTLTPLILKAQPEIREVYLDNLATLLDQAQHNQNEFLVLIRLLNKHNLIEQYHEQLMATLPEQRLAISIKLALEPAENQQHAVISNSPNPEQGVPAKDEQIKILRQQLREQQQQFDSTLFLIQQAVTLNQRHGQTLDQLQAHFPQLRHYLENTQEHSQAPPLTLPAEVQQELLLQAGFYRSRAYRFLLRPLWWMSNKTRKLPGFGLIWRTLQPLLRAFRALLEKLR